MFGVRFRWSDDIKLIFSFLFLCVSSQAAAADAQESPTDSAKARSLRRTVSVPSEGQFPDFPAEGGNILGKELNEFVPVKIQESVSAWKTWKNLES